MNRSVHSLQSLVPNFFSINWSCKLTTQPQFIKRVTIFCLKRDVLECPILLLARYCIITVLYSSFFQLVYHQE